MPATKTSHFLFFPIPAWGKNYYYHSSLYHSTYQHQGTSGLSVFLRRVSYVSRKMLWWPSWLPRTYLRKLELRYRANFLTSLRIVQRLSNESGKCLKIWYASAVYLLVSALKDPFADSVLQPRPVQNDGFIGRCIPYSIPDSIRGQTNYMLCNGYNIWCRSHTLCSCLRCKLVWYVTC